MYGCTVDLTNLQGSEQNLCSRKPHEDRIAWKGFSSLTHVNFCAKVHSNAPSDENSGCESSSGQGMENAQDNSSVGFGKVKSKEEVILEAQRDKRKSTLLH